ncbi:MULTISPECIES: GIY-YIG nuclease family protein [unclassified Mameliella]|uniref:GIY-YIG nuclease family protein n=1 Tax=unclassified Mameliella TaxID=2630630 RepID=UPI00273D5A49|nr:MULTISPECIES: GIY-YIG nuclease family protein [unclassified Mameliella]
MSEGYVYALSNEAMPGLVKIGMTTGNPIKRAQELYQTGVPVPFIVEHSVRIPNAREAEAYVHGALAECRISNRREFFRCEVTKAKDALDEAYYDQVYDFLDAFVPGFTICEVDLFLDPGDIGAIAQECGSSPNEVCSAFYLIQPSEMIPAILRYRTKKARWESDQPFFRGDGK